MGTQSLAPSSRAGAVFEKKLVGSFTGLQVGQRKIQENDIKY